MGACQQLKRGTQKHTCRRLRTAAAAAGASSITDCLKVPSDEAAATAFCALPCAMVFTLDRTDWQEIPEFLRSDQLAAASAAKPQTMNAQCTVYGQCMASRFK